MLKLSEIQHYPIGENGLKYQLHKGQLVYGETHTFPANGYSIDLTGNLNIEFVHDDDFIFSTYIRPVKPILFPISSLIEEIEVNNKKFVPIVELCNIEGGTEDEDDNGNNIFIKSDRMILRTSAEGFENYSYNVYYNTALSQDHVFGFKENNFNHIWINAHNGILSTQGICISNQLRLWKAMLEWKIDFQDLIGQGKAVNVYDLDINPYK